MSEIKLNLLDSHTTLIATTHGSVGDALVAALSADPETIAELELALKRFQKCDSIPASSLVRYDRCEIDQEPYDAGILVIDLASRIVAFESTYSYPGPDGVVGYHDGTQETDFPLRYRLADDWLFFSAIEDYQIHCARRIQERLAQVPLDARAVLYGEPLLDFLIQNVRLLNVQPTEVRSVDVLSAPELEHTGDQPTAILCRQASQAQLDLDAQDLLQETVVDLHRRWLMTPRADLHGQSPREILFAKRYLIDFDLDSRLMQWSYFLEEPPSLSRDSRAYRFGGFGTHEWVMYYDLVRLLIWTAVDDRTNNTTLLLPPSERTTEEDKAPLTSNSKLSNELELLKQKWLTEPRDGYIPAEVIDNERRRRPEAMRGRSMVVDEDCPCCRMMGDESEAGLGIYFCHFDGSHMEDEFAFSWFATHEEWEQWQLEQAKWDREREGKSLKAGPESCDSPTD